MALLFDGTGVKLTLNNQWQKEWRAAILEQFAHDFLISFTPISQKEPTEPSSSHLFVCPELERLKLKVALYRERSI